MGAPWKDRLDALLQKPDPYELDCLITLAGLSQPPQRKRELWAAAAGIGEDWCGEYWQNELSLKENMLALGINGVRVMGPIENMAYNARALYDPNNCFIEVSEQQLDELEKAFEKAGRAPFTRDELWQRLLAHELFHHIEETRKQPLSDLLQSQFGRPVPVQYRDIGAYAFVNACFKGVPCQMADLLWMIAKAPRRLQEALEKIETQRLII